jgi:voltage-gated potassium channel
MSPIYLKHIQRLLQRRELRYPLTLIFILFGMILVFALVFSIFEKDVSFADGLWTAYITVTTIGYGDYSAHTPAGRIITVLTSLFGIGCFAVFTGIIVEKALQRRMKKMKGEGTFTGDGHLVIVNVPSYEEIRELLKELDLSPDFKDIHRVILTDSLPNGDKEIPGRLSSKVDGFIMGLPSTLETLERANVSKAKACLFMSSATDAKLDDTNTLTAGLIEKNWPQVITIISCSRAATLKNLKAFNIDGGINATDLNVGLLVQELEDPGVFEVYSQLSSNLGGSQIYISRTPVGSWEGDISQLTIGQIKLAAIRMNFPADLIGVKRESEEKLLLNSGNDLKLIATDRLVYMAKERFQWRLQSLEILKQKD